MIKLSNISKYYHNEGIVTLALHKVNTEFKLGEFVAITGESGSGKSTLLNVIAGIDSYEEGELYIDGEETSYFDDDDWEAYRRDRVAFIFQNYNLIDSYSVLRNVEVSLVIQGLTKKERVKKAKEIIDSVGLTSHLKHKASKLSGGQKQRLAIARALAKDTNIIVADEPTGNLDSESSKQILELLNEVSKDKLVFIVTHSYEQAAPYVSRKIRLFDGELVEDKVIKDFTEATPVYYEKPKTKEITQSATFAKLNVFSQPKKSILMLLVSLAIVFFVFLIYSGLKVDLESSGNSNFNAYPERLIVTSKDRSFLTEDDYNFILSDRRVDKVIKEDSLLDIDLGLNTQESFGFFGKYINDFVLKNKPMLGRMPVADNEIVLNIYYSDSEEDNLKTFLDKEYDFEIYTYAGNGGKYQVYKLKIVGISRETDYSKQGYYVNDSTLKKMYLMYELSQIENNFLLTSDIMSMWQNVNLKIDESLTGNQVILHNFNNEGFDYAYLFTKQVEIIDSVYNYGLATVLVSEELLLELDVFKYTQFSVNLKNVNDRVALERYLYNNGYYTFSPLYDKSNLEYFNFSLIGSIFTSIGLAIIIFVIYLISYLIFRLIMSTKMKDYTILRIVGAKKSVIRNIIRIELLGSFLVSYIIFFTSYIVIKEYYPFLENLRITDYLIILLINIALSLLIARRFINKQVSKTLYSNLRSE